MKNTNIRPKWARPILNYDSADPLEMTEKKEIIRLIDVWGDLLLTRGCALFHMTASSIIVTPDRQKTLMAYHRIYDSWAWTGGHCDGEGDFEAVARREAEEETGIQHLRRIGEGIAGLEILPVWTHVRRGAVVPSHLHLNVSFLFEAEETGELETRPEENSAVGWIPVAKLGEMCSEPEMMPVYEKLLRRAND